MTGKHPPFCPKTEECFNAGFNGIVVMHLPDGNYESLPLDSETASDRRIIARYQACAWEDARDEWMKNIAIHGDVSDVEAEMCEKNADAWREWERGLARA
jgi:hypothetical protein